MKEDRISPFASSRMLKESLLLKTRQTRKTTLLLPEELRIPPASSATRYGSFDPSRKAITAVSSRVQNDEESVASRRRDMSGVLQEANCTAWRATGEEKLLVCFEEKGF